MSKFQINENYIFHSKKNEISFFDPDSAQMYTLDEVGTKIIKYLKKGKTQEEIIERLISHYDVATDEVEKDTKQFIKELFKNKILIK